MPPPESSDPSSPLHTAAEEHVEGQIEIPGMDASRQQTVTEILQAMEGVSELSIDSKVATVIYDPTLVTIAKLLAALHAAGIDAKHAEAHRDSPMS